MNKLIILLVLVLSLIPIVSATIITVPGDYGNIQTAINNANLGDVIICNADQSDGDLNIHVSVTINGSNVCTADSLIINATGVTVNNLIIDGDYDFGIGSKDSAAIYVNTGGNSSILRNLNIGYITAGNGDSTNNAGGSAYGIYDLSLGNHTFENLTFGAITAGNGFTTTAGITGDGGNGGNAWLMSLSNNIIINNILFTSVTSGSGGDCTASNDNVCEGGSGGYGYLIQGLENITLNKLTQIGVYAVRTGDAGDAGKTGSPEYCGLPGNVKNPRGLYFNGDIFNVVVHNGTAGVKGVLACDDDSEDGINGIDGDIINGYFNQGINVTIYDWTAASASDGGVHGSGCCGDGGDGATTQVILNSIGLNPLFQNILIHDIYGGRGGNGVVGSGVGGYGGNGGDVNIFIGSNSNAFLENITIYNIETGVSGNSASGTGCREAGNSGDHQTKFTGELSDITVHNIKSPDGSDTQGWGGDSGEVYVIFNNYEGSKNVNVYNITGGTGGDATCSASGCQDGEGGTVDVRFPIDVNYYLENFYVHNITAGDDGVGDCDCNDELLHCGMATGWNTRPVLPNMTETQYFNHYVNGTIENIVANRGEWHGVYYQSLTNEINERGFWVVYVNPVIETNIVIPNKYNITWLTNDEMPSGNNFNLYWGMDKTNITNFIVSGTKANLCGTPSAVNCHYEWDISSLDIPKDYWINITAEGWSAAVSEARPQTSLFPLRLGDITSFPANITIDSGNNGNIDFKLEDKLNSSNSPQEVDLNVTAINKYLSTCIEDEEGYCNVPIVFHSDISGIIEYSDINITDHIIPEENQSKIENNGEENISFYLLMKIQFYENNQWVDEATIVDEASPRTLEPGEELRLDSIWNSISWNTSNSTHMNGNYKVYAVATDSEGITLQNDDNSDVVSVYNITLALESIPDTVRLYLNNNESNVTITYGNESNVTATSISGTEQLYRNNVLTGNPEIATLAAGTYIYKANSTGNDDYDANETGVSYVLTVVQATSNVSLLLNGDDATNITVDIRSTVNITGELITGEGIIEFYLDGELISYGNSPLTNLTLFDALGTFNITVVYPDTENYTNSSETHFVIVISANESSARTAIELGINNSALTN